MEQGTSLAAKLGDIGLVGIAMFVATALVAATLGAPALSSQPAASGEGTTAAGQHEGEHDPAEPNASPEPTGETGHHDAGDVPDEDGHDDHAHDEVPQVATPAAHHGGQHDGDGSVHGHDQAPAHNDHASGAGQPHDDGHGHADDEPHDGDNGHVVHESHTGHEDDDHDSHSDHGDDHGQAAGHDEHESHEGDGHNEHEGDGHEGEGHDEHGEGGHDHGAMYEGCDDNHPETQRLVAEVQHSFEHLYPDPATMIAQGYIPYFDAQIPGGLATEGIGHWLNPEYIDNGVELDPTRPESILTDEWYRPIGVMFIENNDGQDPTPVYVNDDGTECAPWHPHTDMPARIGWWYYRQLHDGAAYNDGEVAPDEVTPAMMHMWAVDNPHGVYAAHDHPPAQSREGFPPPRAGYDTPATPLDGEIPDPEDPDSYPFGPEDTCPHCPDANTTDNDHETHEDNDEHGSHEDEGHGSHTARDEESDAREEEDDSALSDVFTRLSGG